MVTSPSGSVPLWNPCQLRALGLLQFPPVCALALAQVAVISGTTQARSQPWAFTPVAEGCDATVPLQLEFHLKKTAGIHPGSSHPSGLQ